MDHEIENTCEYTNKEFAKDLGKAAVVALVPYATFLAVGYGYSLYLKHKEKKIQKEN
jgi:hypothetical protein